MCNQTNSLTNSINFVNSSVERGFSSVAYETQRQTCDIINAMNSGFNAIKEREDAREIQSLRDQVQAYQLSASQQNQTANLIAQLRPCPSPAYVVPNPFGCGCNNYGYPYNGNGGCCNNGCGC